MLHPPRGETCWCGGMLMEHCRVWHQGLQGGRGPMSIHDEHPCPSARLQFTRSRWAQFFSFTIITASWLLAACAILLAIDVTLVRRPASRQRDHAPSWGRTRSRRVQLQLPWLHAGGTCSPSCCIPPRLPMLWGDLDVEGGWGEECTRSAVAVGWGGVGRGGRGGPT
jgi:hypothetical protein